MSRKRCSLRLSAASAASRSCDCTVRSSAAAESAIMTSPTSAMRVRIRGSGVPRPSARAASASSRRGVAMDLPTQSAIPMPRSSSTPAARPTSRSDRYEGRIDLRARDHDGESPTGEGGAGEGGDRGVAVRVGTGEDRAVALDRRRDQRRIRRRDLLGVDRPIARDDVIAAVHHLDRPALRQMLIQQRLAELAHVEAHEQHVSDPLAAHHRDIGRDLQLQCRTAEEGTGDLQRSGGDDVADDGGGFERPLRPTQGLAGGEDRHALKIGEEDPGMMRGCDLLRLLVEARDVVIFERRRGGERGKRRGRGLELEIHGGGEGVRRAHEVAPIRRALAIAHDGASRKRRTPASAAPGRSPAR